jgi:hypothetical protein
MYRAMYTDFATLAQRLNALDQAFLCTPVFANSTAARLSLVPHALENRNTLGYLFGLRQLDLEIPAPLPSPPTIIFALWT